MITIHEDGLITVDTLGQVGRRYAAAPPLELRVDTDLLNGVGPMGSTWRDTEAREGCSIIPPEYQPVPASEMAKRGDALSHVTYFRRVS